MNLETTAELRQRIVTAAGKGLIGADMAALCRDIATLQAENVRLAEELEAFDDAIGSLQDGWLGNVRALCLKRVKGEGSRG